MTQLNVSFSTASAPKPPVSGSKPQNNTPEISVWTSEEDKNKKTPPPKKQELSVEEQIKIADKNFPDGIVVYGKAEPYPIGYRRIQQPGGKDTGWQPMYRN